MSKTDHLVDLFIVGQPKSGTSALGHYLSQHPQIFMSVPKEPNYFASDIHEESDAFHGHLADYFIRTPEQYLSLFAPAKDEEFLGEASTVYLYSKRAAENISRHNPDAKIVISLRSPVDMIHALHAQYLTEATEDEPDFAEALNKEIDRKEGRHVPSQARCPSLLFYSERIKYAEHIERFVERFPRENVLILTAEELREDSRTIYKSVLSVLGADTSFTPDFEPVHENRKPRSLWMNKVTRNPRFRKVMHTVLGPRIYTFTHKRVAEKVLLKQEARDPMPEDLEQRLRELARPEVEKVSKLLQRDLVEHWGYSSVP